MFCRNEKVVYPGYGVAIIQDIITRNVQGQKSEFFQLRFINKEMTILVPVTKIAPIKLRRLSNDDEIESLFKILSAPFLHKRNNNDEKSLIMTWSKRFKEYQSKIQTGDMVELCHMYRELKTIEMHKELSFGEKSLLLQIEDLLAEEVAIVKNYKYTAAQDAIKKMVSLQLKLDGIIKKEEIQKTF